MKMSEISWLIPVNMCLFILIFSNSQLQAQRFAIGTGSSLFTDLAFIDLPTVDNDSDKGGVKISFFSLSLEAKLNLVEFNTDACISLATAPSVGIMTGENWMSEEYYGNVKIPLWVQFDYGAFSTFETMKEKGFGIGVGVEYNKIGLLGKASDTFPGFVTASARAGYRFYSSSSKLREVAIKYGFGTDVTTLVRTAGFINGEEVIQEQDVTARISTVQLSYIVYFNY